MRKQDWILLMICGLMIVGVSLINKVNAQPEMVIAPNVFKNSIQIDRYTFDIRDTASGCFDEGHFRCTVVNGQCKTERVVSYTTMLFNAGNAVALYGSPAIDTLSWSYDSCQSHRHYHYLNGIQVTLERWSGTEWVFVSLNSKLAYDMVNQQKYPAEYKSSFAGFDSLFNPVYNHTFSLHSLADLDWFTQYAPIDSASARWRSECITCSGGGGYDMFYTYPEVDYNSDYRGILPYFGDSYGNDTDGNWNHLDSVDGFYRLKAWHIPDFEQQELFPDTVEVIFLTEGDNIIHDTVPSLPVLPDTIPDAIVATVIEQRGNNDIGNREVIVTGVDFPITIYRHWVHGRNIQVGGIPLTIYSNRFTDNSAVPDNYIYKCNGVISNKVKYR